MKKFLISILSFVLVVGFMFSFLLLPATTSASVVVDAKSAFLMDAGTGKVLYAKDESERLPVASMTKTMTLLLTFEEVDAGRLDLNEKILVSENAAGMGGSQVFLDANNEYTANDLIASIVIASANDASVAIAERIAGSEEDFVVLMNKKVKELGLENTNFANCTGLPAPSNYSSAKDVSIIFSNLIKHEKYFDYSKIYLDELTHPSGRVTGLTNTNKLVRFYEGCDGGKTGSTNEAKFCLCATAKRDNLRLISCVVGAENSKVRNKQVSDLFNFGFNNYASIKVVDKAEVYNVPVKKSSVENLSAVPKEDYFYLVKKGEKPNLEVRTELFSTKAPVSIEDKVGEILIINSGEIVKKIDLLSNENVKIMGYGDSLDEILDNWSLKNKK